MFQPLGDGIDVLDVTTGRLVYRVELPTQLASIYDNLVVDGSDNTLAAITASGVSVIELDSLALPEWATRPKNMVVAASHTRRPGAAAGKHGASLRGPQLRYGPRSSSEKPVRSMRPVDRARHP